MIADFLQFEFLRNTLYTGLLIGLIAPLLGCFIVVRRLSLIADALSHVTLAGIAFGLLLEKKLATPVISPFYAGLGFSVVASLLIEKLRSMFRNFQEIAIPIILSGGVGLSVIFISLANGFTTDLFSYLFGSVSAVSSDDLRVIVIISIIVLLVIGVLYKQLLVLSFDEEHARVSGLHARAIHFIFMLLTALVIAASIRIVGVLLVSALMTIPVAAAIRLAKGFKQAMILAILFGETSVIVGLFSGYYFEIPPGGTIVVVSILILLLSFIVQKLLLVNKRKTAFEKGVS